MNPHCDFSPQEASIHNKKNINNKNKQGNYFPTEESAIPIPKRKTPLTG
jgi:hypothetical protein